MACGLAEHRARRGSKGVCSAQSSGALLADNPPDSAREVTCGGNHRDGPRKRSTTIEVVDERGQTLATGRYGTDKASYAEILKSCRGYAERIWAVEGCNGIG